MKTKIKLQLLLFILLSNFIIGQRDISKLADFCIYKTDADFFNKKGTILGKCLSYDKIEDKVTYYDKNNNEQHIVLKDSNIYAFKDPALYIDSIQMYFINTVGKNYQTFCGGNKNYFIISTLTGYGHMDSDGYATQDFVTYGNNSSNSSEYGYNFIEFFYYDKVNNIRTKDIKEILSKDPILMEKYLAEKKESNKRFKYAIANKYFKFYVQAHSK